jgi:hypothetical protein
MPAIRGRRSMKTVSNLHKKKVTALELSEVQAGRVYLARFRVNSKTITWQPCWVVDTEVGPTPNGSFRCIQVRFMLQGQYGWVYVNTVDGTDLLVDGARDPSLKEINSKWVDREKAKADRELALAEKQVDFLTSLKLEVDRIC